MLDKLNLIIGAAAGIAIGLAAAVLFYEGIPIGPFARIPFVGPILAEVTGGRVDAVRREALQGYVLEARAVAAESRLAEVERQLEAGRKALDGFADLLATAQAELAERAAADDKIIKDYETSRPDRERLDSADIDFILRR